MTEVFKEEDSSEGIRWLGMELWIIILVIFGGVSICVLVLIVICRKTCCKKARGIPTHDLGATKGAEMVNSGKNAEEPFSSFHDIRPNDEEEAVHDSSMK